MKQVFFITLILFLSDISIMGQINDGGCLISPTSSQQHLQPEIKDSVRHRLDSLFRGMDSLKISGYYKGRLHGRPGYPHYYEDEMVIHPGPSLDRMPNANITTPGVHYTLKIVPPVRPYLKRYRFHPPYYHH